MADSSASRSHQRLARVGGALVAFLLIGAGWLMLQGDQTGSTSRSDAVGAGASPSNTVAPPPEAVVVPAVAGSPRRIVIPALSIDAAVDSIRAVGGTLEPPSDPQRIGWWADGAQPGAPHGTALLTGHTVHTGGGAFDDLEDLTTGDRVEVYGDRGSAAYSVASVQTISREQVAIRHRQLFKQSGPSRLVLVTCEDWDGVAYQSSVIVTAKPVPARG